MVDAVAPEFLPDDVLPDAPASKDSGRQKSILVVRLPVLHSIVGFVGFEDADPGTEDDGDATFNGIDADSASDNKDDEDDEANSDSDSNDEVVVDGVGPQDAEIDENGWIRVGVQPIQSSAPIMVRKSLGPKAYRAPIWED